jgi:hypothetical protein
MQVARTTVSPEGGQRPTNVPIPPVETAPAEALCSPGSSRRVRRDRDDSYLGLVQRWGRHVFGSAPRRSACRPRQPTSRRRQSRSSSFRGISIIRQLADRAPGAQTVGTCVAAGQVLLWQMGCGVRRGDTRVRAASRWSSNPGVSRGFTENVRQFGGLHGMRRGSRRG